MPGQPGCSLRPLPRPAPAAPLPRPAPAAPLPLLAVPWPPRPRRLAAVLFDIDGTLFNSDALHLQAFQESLQEENYDGGKRISEA